MRQTVIAIAVCVFGFCSALVIGYEGGRNQDTVSLDSADVMVLVTKKKQFFSASVEGEPVVICNNLRVSKTALEPIGISSTQYPVRYDVKATGEMDYKANTLFARTCYLK